MIRSAARLGVWCLAMTELVGGQTPEWRVSVPDTNRLEGIDAGVDFQVTSAVPMRFVLVVTPLAGGQPTRVDSTPGAQRSAILRLIPVGSATPRFPSGGYWVDLIASTPTGATATSRFGAVFETPAVQLTPIPLETALTGFLVEERRTPLAHSIASAVVVGAATVLAGRLGRHERLENVGVSRSTRPIFIGISLGAVVGIASQLVGGQPVPAAIEHNELIRARFREERELAESTNAFLLASYQGLVILSRTDP